MEDWSQLQACMYFCLCNVMSVTMDAGCSLLFANTDSKKMQY